MWCSLLRHTSITPCMDAAMVLTSDDISSWCYDPCRRWIKVCTVCYTYRLRTKSLNISNYLVSCALHLWFPFIGILRLDLTLYRSLTPVGRDINTVLWRLLDNPPLWPRPQDLRICRSRVWESKTTKRHNDFKIALGKIVPKSLDPPLGVEVPQVE